MRVDQFILEAMRIEAGLRVGAIGDQDKANLKYTMERLLKELKDSGKSDPKLKRFWNKAVHCWKDKEE